MPPACVHENAWYCGVAGGAAPPTTWPLSFTAMAKLQRRRGCRGRPSRPSASTRTRARIQVEVALKPTTWPSSFTPQAELNEPPRVPRSIAVHAGDVAFAPPTAPTRATSVTARSNNLRSTESPPFLRPNVAEATNVAAASRGRVCAPGPAETANVFTSANGSQLERDRPAGLAPEVRGEGVTRCRARPRARQRHSPCASVLSPRMGLLGIRLKPGGGVPGEIPDSLHRKIPIDGSQIDLGRVDPASESSVPGATPARLDDLSGTRPRTHASERGRDMTRQEPRNRGRRPAKSGKDAPDVNRALRRAARFVPRVPNQDRQLCSAQPEMALLHSCCRM